MTQEEYFSTDWHRGNRVKLNNGKEYPVRGTKKKYLVLYSDEYEKHFVADYRIIECRTSDYIEPYVEKEKPIETPKEETKAPKAASPVIESKKEDTKTVKTIVKPATVADSVATSEQPKRKRKRITITRIEKVQIK